MPLTQLLFSFSGRINRAPYWAVTVSLIGILLVLAVIIGAATQIFGPAILILLVIFYIPALWIGLAIAVKRLHDRNKSAWWLLVFYLVPAILQGVGQQTGDVTGSILLVAGFAITIWAFIELGCLRGTVGPNQYGPDPLDAALAR
jgi:uncharacterized membrane protein YhaH (DUF805 family)